MLITASRPPCPMISQYCVHHVPGQELIYLRDGRKLLPSSSELHVLCGGELLLTLCNRFLYMLILCMDANFRLKSQMVSSYSRDPGLGIGWSYFVPREPFDAYVLNHTSDEDVCCPFVQKSTESADWCFRSVPVWDLLLSQRQTPNFRRACDIQESGQYHTHVGNLSCGL